MSGMFQEAISFNQNINTILVTKADGSTYTAWNVSEVQDMYMMFSGCGINPIPEWYNDQDNY